jgi:hypothetical protein
MVDNNRKRVTAIGLISVAAVVFVLIVASRAQSNRPSAPQSVDASAGNGFAIVSWSRPVSDGGHAVTRYVVTSHPAGSTCTTYATTMTCTLWELTNGTSYRFTVAARNKLGLGPNSRSSNAVTPLSSLRVLPVCNVYNILPTKPVASVIVTVVTKYYAARNLTPLTIFQNLETMLGVHQFSVGFHYCKNVGGGTSGYGGYVPRNAVAAVRVLVEHKPDSLGFSAHFLTVAEIPKVGWKVVGVGTGP